MQSVCRYYRWVGNVDLIEKNSIYMHTYIYVCVFLCMFQSCEIIAQTKDDLETMINENYRLQLPNVDLQINRNKTKNTWYNEKSE